MYRELGVVSVSIAVFGLAFLILKWPGKTSMTFSQHAAQSKLASTYYFVLFSTTLPLFYLFMSRWFIPFFGISHMIYWFLIPGLLFQEVAVLIPETEGKRVLIHRAAAFAMALLFMPILVVTVATGSVSNIAKIVCVLTLLSQIIIVMKLIPVKGYHKNALVLQSVYFVGFMLSILVVTYS